jgi:hypothetical protein
MTRLVPIVKRRVRNPASFPRAVAIAQPIELAQVPRWMEDAKLFAMGWVAGLIVFGAFLA